MEVNQTNPPTGKGKKALLLSLGTLVLGTLAFFGFKTLKKSKKENETNDHKSSEVDTASSFQTPAYHKPDSGVPAVRSDASFPLRKGSKGNKIRMLQTALIRSYGDSILPKYGADGDFGSELEKALKEKGYAVPLQKADFEKITAEKTEQPAANTLTFDPAATAKTFYYAFMSRNFDAAITLLKGLKSTTDYSLVSEQLKNNYRIRGVRQTLVNAALSTFNESSQKLKIQEAFKNIGLKYDGNKWSLAGFYDTNSTPYYVITQSECTIHLNDDVFTPHINVPANVVLGILTNQGRHSVIFKTTGGKLYAVEKAAVYFLPEQTNLNGLNGPPAIGDEVMSTRPVLIAESDGRLLLVPAKMYLGKIRDVITEKGMVEISTGIGNNIKVFRYFLKKAKL